MKELGFTRSAFRADHLLQTPDTFVRAPLPGMRNATAIVHIHPNRGAGFMEFTVEFEANGYLDAASEQRFLYVLEGAVNAGGAELYAGDYAYLPPLFGSVSAHGTARAVVIEKPYETLEGVAGPEFMHGRESRITGQPLGGDPDLTVRTLIPADPAFDFAVNTMTFQPGASLSMVEIHVMEHGLLMLEGGGIYRLGEHWYPATAGDFIWMAPYCPQWFGAIGKTPAKYLIYKDWNR